MKKVTSILVVVVALLVVMTGMALASTISNTKHNLSLTSNNTISGDVQEVCIYCHTPHGGDQAVAPLWNRTNNIGRTFVTYGEGQSSSTYSQTPGQPSGVSMACLSCHDGASSINTLLNKGGQPYNTGTDTKIPVGLANLGVSLLNDHPIGVSVDNAISHDNEIKTPTLAGVRVFGANHTVECASCHNVHDNSRGLFLAAFNTNSDLCLACHMK